MPELPEVETIARDLRGRVTGATILDATTDWPPTLRSHAPDAFAAAIRRRTIEGVGRRGKQLLVWLSGNDQDPEPAVMTVHLKMTGQLFVVPAGSPGDRHVRASFRLDGGRELRFRDIRKFGRLGLYRRDEATGEPIEGEAAGVLATGVEPLSDEFTARRFGQLLAGRRRRLKPLLLDQAFLAGIGNIYADESLWRSRLHPLRDAASLHRDEVRRLHRELRGVLAEAVDRRGSSVDDYTAPDGDGSMQEYLQVYQRSGEPCLRCGRPIRRIVVGGRSTHFCSWCQRLSADERRAAANLLRGLAPGRRARADGAPARRGRRWTELDGEGALGRSASEEAAAMERRRRTEATRKAAAARRAAARGDAARGDAAARADGAARSGATAAVGATPSASPAEDTF